MLAQLITMKIQTYNACNNRIRNGLYIITVEFDELPQITLTYYYLVGCSHDSCYYIKYANTNTGRTVITSI